MGERVIAGAKLDTLYGVDVSGIDPETSVALTKAILAREPIDTGRRIIITWPAKTTAGVLPTIGVAVEDADTGEQILGGVKLVLGTDAGYTEAVIEAEITSLVNADGDILGAGEQPVKNEDGDWLNTKVFKFAVAEMRIAAP